jgi:hypothetical protein
MTLSVLSHILSILILSIVSAFIGLGFNKMQDDGMAFTWYKDWLNRMPYRFRDLTPLEMLETGKTHHMHKSKFLYYLTKPLGLCIICNTTWIGMIACLIVATKWNYMLIFDVIATGMSSAGIVILLINKYNQLQRTK